MGAHQRARAPARFRPDTSRTRRTHCISPARRVRQTDEADRATASCSQYALHPMWGTAPFTSRYTLYVALHPIRRGAMPTDRVQRHFQQALSRPRDHTNHQPTSTPPPPTSAAPFTSRYTRCGALHPMWGAAPDQKRCNAHGSGAAPNATSVFSDAHYPPDSTSAHLPPSPRTPATMGLTITL